VQIVYLPTLLAYPHLKDHPVTVLACIALSFVCLAIIARRPQS